MTNLDSVQPYWQYCTRINQTSKRFNWAGLSKQLFVFFCWCTKLLQVLRQGHGVHLSLCFLEGRGDREDLEDRVDLRVQLGLGHPVGNEDSEKKKEDRNRKKRKLNSNFRKQRTKPLNYKQWTKTLPSSVHFSKCWEQQLVVCLSLISHSLW